MAATTMMTRSGFCAHPSPGSHTWCGARELSCDCACHGDASALADLEAEQSALAAGYRAGQQAESDIIPTRESGEGQGT